ncbi:LOW QUALITY PROTEIN: hypothetical protein ACHAW6_004424 [Cyclotella cf. meneghiniana]
MLLTKLDKQNEMLPTKNPEIQRTNLGKLSAEAMGIKNLLGFDFMDPPPVANLVSAIESLHAFEAPDNKGCLTRLGYKMEKFLLEANLSKMLYISINLGCSDVILTITSLLSVEKISFVHNTHKVKQPRRRQIPSGRRRPLDTSCRLQRMGSIKIQEHWCFENFIQAGSMRHAQDVQKQLITIMDRYKLDILISGKNYKKICMAISAGFFKNAEDSIHRRDT